MRLISVHIKNFKIHQNRYIEFDKKLTLIGGPNESGKSTIAEAIHKALFLKYKGNTDEHKEIKSNQHSGDPEVELDFEIQGDTYKLIKCFGSKGTAKLISSKNETLHNDQAEDKLGELLKTTTGLTRKDYKEKWNNLWIWQGSASENPNFFANNNRNNLIKGLQEKGAAIVLQSNADLEISAVIRKKLDEIFVSNGSPKKNSPLEFSDRKRNEISELYIKAKDRLNNLENASIKYEKSLNEQKQNKKLLENLNSELKVLDQSEKLLTKLKSDEELLQNKFNHASKDLEELDKINGQIIEINNEIIENRNILIPLNKQQEILIKKKEETEISNNSLQNELEQLRNSNSSDTKMKDYYQNLKNIIGLEEEINRLEKEKEEIDNYNVKITKYKQDLAALTDIDDQKIDKLKEFENKIKEIKISIKSISTSLEILKADRPVKINNKETSEVVFTLINDTTIDIGEGVKFKIKPGGSTSLTELNLNLNELTNDLENHLRLYKVKDLDNALFIKIKREDLAAKINFAEDFIKKKNSNQITGLLTQKRGELEGAKNSHIEFLSELGLNGETEKSNLDKKISELKNKIEENEQNIKSLTGQINGNKYLIKHDYDLLTELGKKLTDLEINISANKKTIENIETTYGSDEMRLEKTAEAQKNKDAIEIELNQMRKDITSINPKQLEADKQRINRAEVNAKDKRDELIETIANLKAVLYFDGNEDPREVFDKYEKKLKIVDQEYESRRLEGEAIKMLNDLFQTEQENLSKEFTRPLAEKVNGYLSHIFKQSVYINLEDKEGVFIGLTISRNNVVNQSALSFQELSGGAKEQVAAAFRLAMAEVLATDYDGCLPVIFDDAFAYSDPDRIVNLQSMLDYAANEGGLQLIVFSCNPNDYTLLGAKEIMLD